MIDQKLLQSELIELATLGNLLNSVAGQLKQAREDLATAQTRVEASERSILNIQDAIFEHLNTISKKLKDEPEGRKK